MNIQNAIIPAAMILAAVPCARAQEVRWASPTSGSWGVDANWQGESVPDAAGTSVTFPMATGIGTLDVTLDGGRTVGRLVFESSGPDWTLIPGTGGVLTLDAGESGVPEVVVGADGYANIGVPLNGTQGLVKSGLGTLRLADGNLYSGQTTVTEGILSLGGNGSLGSSTGILLDGGWLGTVGIDQGVGMREVSSSQGIVLGANGGGLETAGIGGTNQGFIVNSVISGAGGLRIAGPGQVILNAQNSYSGITSVINATLRLGAGGAAGTGRLDLMTSATLASTDSSSRQLLNDIFLATPEFVITFGDAIGSGDLTLGNLGLSSTGSSRAILTNANVTLLGQLGGTATAGTIFEKSGTGTLSLNAAAGSGSYTGGTHLILDGALMVNNATGNGLGTGGSVYVASGATIGGSGSIVQAVTVEGTLSPGNSIESLVTGDAAFLTGSTYTYEMQAGAAEPADLLHVNGELSLVGVVSLDLTGADGPWVPDSKVTLVSYGEYGGGLFAGIPDDNVQTFGANRWLFDYNDTTGGTNFASDQVGATGFLTMTLMPVPEPAAAALAAAGGALVIARRRRRTA